MTSYWFNNLGVREAKKLIEIHEKSKGYNCPEKIVYKTLTELLTGHCPVKYNLKKKMGEKNGSKKWQCRLCLAAIETAEHIQCNCEANHFTKTMVSGKDCNAV